jgi:hypothetical protein
MPPCTSVVNSPRAGASLCYIVAVHRITSVSVVFAAAVLAACGSSTAPPPPSYSVARHLDSLAIGAADSQAQGRNGFLSYAIAVLGEGTSAATVSLSVNGASQSYQAVALDIVETSAGPFSAPSDSMIVLTAWTSPNAASLVTVWVAAPDTVTNLADTEDTVSNQNNTASYSASVGSFTGSGKCHAITGLSSASYLMTNTTCTSGTITASFQFGVTADGSAPANTFVLGSTALPAVRVVLPAGDGGVQRVRQLLRASR